MSSPSRATRPTRPVGHRGRRRRALAALLAVVLPGCAIATDEAPRDIDQQVLGLTAPGSPSEQPAEGPGRIYLTTTAAGGQPPRLRPVARDVPDQPGPLLDTLLAGPNTAEAAAGVRTALPPDLRVNSRTRRGGGVLVVDVSEEMQELSGNALVLALAQIVYTVTQIEGIERVAVTVDGSQPSWPDGTGELQSAPLTVHDYPLFEPSSQPPYPAVPSP